MISNISDSYQQNIQTEMSFQSYLYIVPNHNSDRLDVYLVETRQSDELLRASTDKGISHFEKVTKILLFYIIHN